MSRIALIRDRTAWLGEKYPFAVVEGEVRFAPVSPTSQFLPYLFLLLCSNRNCVPHLKNQLPVQFEYLCKEALRDCFQNGQESCYLAKTAKTEKRYSVGAAIPNLAAMLNASVLDETRITDTREFGIDIVAICPFEDQSAYQFFAFAQCTVGQEWWDKRHEANAENSLAGFIQLNARHTNFLMIPYFPRYNLLQWSEDASRTGNCILCDRLRICGLLEKSSSFSCDEPPDKVAAAFREIEMCLSNVANTVSKAIRPSQVWTVHR